MMLRESSATVSEGNETYGEQKAKSPKKPETLPSVKPVQYDERRDNLISYVSVRGPEAVQLAIDGLMKLVKGKKFAALVKEYQHADPHSLHMLVRVILGYRPALKNRVSRTLKRCVVKSDAIARSKEPEKSPYRKVMDQF